MNLTVFLASLVTLAPLFRRRTLDNSKRKFRHLTAVAIIFDQRDPTRLFMEMKDDGLPMIAFRRHFNFIGGNWIGEPAKSDFSPLDTLRREITEEISLDRPMRSATELVQLDLSSEATFAPTPISNVTINQGDRDKLERLRLAIIRKVLPFGDFAIEVPKSVLDAADPNNTKPGWRNVVSYYLVPLDNVVWSSLVSLQKRFSNLSAESVSVITSLDEIVESGAHIAFGHDRVLQSFFLALGYSEALNLPLVPGITCTSLGPTKTSYLEYLRIYDVARKPLAN